MTISPISGASAPPVVDKLQDLKSQKAPDVSASVAAPASPAKISDAELKKSVDKINQFINSNNSINLNLDQGSGKVVVQIVDKETNTVIRQIPSAEVLAIAKDLDGKKGILLNDQA